MTKFAGLARKKRTPNWQGLVDNILRKGTPDRVYHMELFHDGEILDAIAEKFSLDIGIGAAPESKDYGRRMLIAVNRFCGWDTVTAGVNTNFGHKRFRIDDTATELTHAGGRYYQNEHTGPIMSWEDFEKFNWPDPTRAELTADLEWFQENLPDDMCIIGGLTCSFTEQITWLMGYETLCFKLFEQRDLVQAIADKLLEIFRICVERMLEFDRVKMIWASDDMGFKTSLMVSPADMREFVLPNHRICADISHAAGRPYLLHVCGNISEIIDDLIDDVKIDAKHSYEDTIEDVREVKKTYGQRVAMIGGIDVDFLCRSDERAIRKRVRDTLDICQEGGGYCLGTGNSVANYIPLDSYLAMVDEGMLYA